MSAVKKLVFPLFFGSLLILVIQKTTPPTSLSSASIIQTISFFGPLLLFLTFLANLYWKSLIKSLSFSLGLIVLLVLAALGVINLLAAGIILLIGLILIKLLTRTSKKPAPLKAKPPSPKLKQLPEAPKRPKLSRIKKEK